jgi:hypothetical protein
MKSLSSKEIADIQSHMPAERWWGFFKRRVIHTGNEPYLVRWHIIPRNKWFNIYLHHILKSDDERALHDHPWASLSFKLKGPLSEVYSLPLAVGFEGMPSHDRNIPWLWPVYRSSTFAHRLVLPPGKSAWTIFITGRHVRLWGFWCPQGWRYWRDYERSGGCGEI